MITLSLQRAHEEEAGDKRGAVAVEEAVKTFCAFPWREQRAEAKELEICSASLFLNDTSNGASFFVSVLDGEGALEFIISFEREEEVEAWSLLGKRTKKKLISEDSYGNDSATAERAIRAFFNDRQELRRLVAGSESY
jgi:hypothetical protein